MCLTWTTRPSLPFLLPRPILTRYSAISLESHHFLSPSITRLSFSSLEPLGIFCDLKLVKHILNISIIHNANDGDIILNTECNPLHGPRVEEIIKALEDGGTPDKQAYVEEGIYACGADVKSVTIDGTDYEVTEVTDDVISKRAY